LWMSELPNGTIIGFPWPGHYIRTLTTEGEKEPFHILGLRWSEGGPRIVARPLSEKDGGLFYVDAPVEEHLASMDRLDLRCGPDIWCVGTTEGGHEPCPGRAVLEGFAQCRACLSVEIPDPACIFEPHCHRGSCGAFFCQAPHVVYVAMYGTRMKIGMTQAARVRERGAEQGADYMLPLARLSDRYSARALEGWLSSRYRLPQSMNSRTLLMDMARPAPLAAAKEKALSFLERLRREQVTISDITGSRSIRVEALPRDMPDEGVVPGPYPVPGRLDAVPRPIDASIVRGEVVGFKGKWGIVRSNGALAAFRTGDLVGRIVLFATGSFPSGQGY